MDTNRLIELDELNFRRMEFKAQEEFERFEELLTIPIPLAIVMITKMSEIDREYFLEKHKLYTSNTYAYFTLVKAFKNELKSLENE